MALTSGSSAQWSDIRNLFDRVHAERARWGLDTQGAGTTAAISGYGGGQGVTAKASTIGTLYDLFNELATSVNTAAGSNIEQLINTKPIKGNLIQPVIPVEIGTKIENSENTCAFNTAFDSNFTANASFGFFSFDFDSFDFFSFDFDSFEFFSFGFFSSGFYSFDFLAFFQFDGSFNLTFGFNTFSFNGVTRSCSFAFDGVDRSCFDFNDAPAFKSFEFTFFAAGFCSSFDAATFYNSL